MSTWDVILNSNSLTGEYYLSFAIMPLPPPYLGSSNNGGNGGNGGNGKSTSTSGSMNLGVGSLSIAALVLLHFMN